VDIAMNVKNEASLLAIQKGKSVVHECAILNNLYDKIPNYKVKKSVLDKDPVVISGPYNKQLPPQNFNNAFGVTISTYPLYFGRKNRDGDPICDSYRIQTYRGCQIICVADGCGWGERPREASNRLRDNFVLYFTEKAKNVKTLKDISEHLVTSFAYANHYISYDKSDIWMAGTSTALGGLVVELERDKDSTLPAWAFVFITIGDCKCFKYDVNTETCVDVTAGNRMNITDARDPGGRLGPQKKNGDPDLRNLDLYWVGCNEGDILIAMSDGVHDNLDPQSIGLPPSDFGLEQSNWDDVDIQQCTNIKTKFMNELITKIITTERDDGSSLGGLNLSTPPTKRAITPALITKKLVRHCLETTKNSREWMNQTLRNFRTQLSKVSRYRVV